MTLTFVRRTCWTTYESGEEEAFLGGGPVLSLQYPRRREERESLYLGWTIEWFVLVRIRSASVHACKSARAKEKTRRFWVLGRGRRPRTLEIAYRHEED